MSLGHDRGKHRGDAMFSVELKRDVVALRIRRNEIVGFAAVVVDVDKAGCEDLAVTIYAACGGRNVGEFLVDGNSGNSSFRNEEFAFQDEIGKCKTSVTEVDWRRIRHGVELRIFAGINKNKSDQTTIGKWRC